MAGLLSDVLPFVYSRADALKRRMGGLLSDPMGTLTQAVNDANDRAGGLLAQTEAATKEGLTYGPATQALANTVASAYNPMGITVYHGSPHKFAKFDSSKIGTGEGAQAYGHGLYLAESPDVAGAYRKNLSQDTFLAPSGKTINRQTLADMGFGRGDIDVMLGAVQRHGGDFTAAADAIATHRPAAAKFLRGIGIRGSVNEGSLYKVDLPDSAVARMLDWDKPLSQQAPEVQQWVKRDDIRALHQMTDKGLSQATGADLYRNITAGLNAKKTGELPSQMMQNNLLSGAIDASDALRQLGIPGIRYLDGGSRGLGGGTSNFVVFPGEEGLLKILERNGAPVR